MFVETKTEGKEGLEQRFDAWARRHPGWFTLVLVVLAIVTTTALLFQTGFTFIMYQGF
jgi:hypothetical protein